MCIFLSMYLCLKGAIITKNIIPVTRPLLPDFDEYVSELRDVWASKWLTNYGPKHQQLETELKEYLGVDNISLFANGHLALQIAIKALGLQGEIITTPFTYASTTHAIVECGCTPVFCDIDPVTFTLDYRKVEELITKETCAILAVHVYGTVCNDYELRKIADKHGLKLIYDAAHTFGVKADGKGIGTLGDISMFSFHATKVYNTVEGGCLTYSDPALKEKIEAICSFGFETGNDSAAYVGTNAKMTEVSAAMGICNLRHIDDALKKRGKIVRCYETRLSDIEGLQLICKQEGVQTNYAYYPVIFDRRYLKVDREAVILALNEHGIFPRKYFSPLTSDFVCYRERYPHGNTPIADRIAQDVLVLPLYADLSEDACNKICDIIIEVINK